MIKCKECGGQIQSNVEFCPNCGYPIKTKRKFKNAAICIGTILIFCTAAIYYSILEGIQKITINLQTTVYLKTV